MISDYDISKYLPSTKQNVSMARNTWSPNLWARVSSIVHTPMDTKDTCNTYIFYNYLQKIYFLQRRRPAAARSCCRSS